MSGEHPPPDPWSVPATPPTPPAPGYPPPYGYQPGGSPPQPYPPQGYGTTDAYGYPTYAPAPPDLPRRTDPVSVAALVTGCLLLGPVAFVLGIVGVVRTRRAEVGGRGLGGRGLAVTGIVLGVVGCLLGVVVAASVAFAHSEVGKDVLGVATGDKVFVEDLAAGDCFLEPDANDAIMTIDVVDCALPHDLEVMVVDTQAFAAWDANAAYPGEDEVTDRADTACQDAFETFVGTAYDDSELDFFTIYPSQESWEQGNDRTVTCSVGDPSRQVTGTLAGAAR